MQTRSTPNENNQTLSTPTKLAIKHNQQQSTTTKSNTTHQRQTDTNQQLSKQNKHDHTQTNAIKPIKETPQPSKSSKSKQTRSISAPRNKATTSTNRK